jgi:enediyne biosynthesis protein E3
MRSKRPGAIPVFFLLGRVLGKCDNRLNSEPVVGLIFKMIFGISKAETTFARRGFRGGENGRREGIERVGTAFVAGYQAALENSRAEILVPRLEAMAPDLRGFAYEGAAMGLGLLDRVTPWRRDRVQSFLRGAGDAHTYMVHVALGWVAARMPGNLEKQMEPLDPLLRWLVLDGYGFHEGFFHWPKYLRDGLPPRRVTGYATRVFDQGLGRSLWFVEGGGVARLRETVAGFAESRRADLWSGVGLASVYAGEVTDAELKLLLEAAGKFQPQLAQGAAFAAKARHRAGNPTAYTERACRILCGLSSADAAALTDAALENLPAHGAEPAYEIWRQRIQKQFSRGKELKR